MKRENGRQQRRPPADGPRDKPPHPQPPPPPAAKTPRQELLDELWSGENPFSFADPRRVDRGYPNSNLPADLIEAILQTIHPAFWLELGTALGDSAIRTAAGVKALHLETSICCIDAFTGDVNMWSWEKGRRQRGEWRYMNLQDGRPTMYERFLANVRDAGHDDLIVPLPSTTQVGLRLLRLLVAEGRLSQLPQVIYLDSAHEPGETLLELQSAWATLGPGGILFGDDWLWPSVRGDVQTFSGTIEIDSTRLAAFLRRFPESELAANIFLYRGHWALFKQAG